MIDSKVEIKAVVVSTINMCTQHCWHCKHGVISPHPHFMPEGFAVKIIDDLAFIDYRNRLSLFNINEPLLDPRLEDFYKYAKKRLPNAFLSLSSNGDLVTEDVLQRLFNAGLQKITICLSHNQREEVLISYQSKFGNDKVHIVNHMNPRSFHNRGGLIASSDLSQIRYNASGCALPFKQMSIYADCAVGLCSADQAENIKVEIGNMPIWQVFFENEVLNKYREMLKSNSRIMSPCVACSYNGVDYFN